MIIKKNILFYKLNLQLSRQINMFDQDADLKRKVKNFKEHHTTDELRYVHSSNKYIVDIIDINEEYLFASYGKLNDYNKSRFIRVRDKEKLTPQEYHDYIEMFTYFYIDFNTNKIVVINSQLCKGFKKNVAEFLINHFKLSNIYESVEVISTLNENISEAIDKTKTVQSVDIKYHSNRFPQNEFRSLSDLSTEDEQCIKSAHLKITFTPVPSSKSVVHNLINAVRKKKDLYQSVGISTSDGEIEVLEQTITKKVTHEFNEDDFSESEILNILKRYINDY